MVTPVTSSSPRSTSVIPRAPSGLVAASASFVFGVMGPMRKDPSSAARARTMAFAADCIMLPRLMPSAERSTEMSASPGGDTCPSTYTPDSSSSRTSLTSESDTTAVCCIMLGTWRSPMAISM